MRIAALLPVMLLVATAADADSDGYFCAAAGYLAFETRLSSTPMKHELHVVRFSKAGISAMPPIVLDDFQVHAMSCRSGAVEINGWEKTYSIDIRNAERPSIASRDVPFDPGSMPASNLGHLAKPQVIALEADGASRFELVISRVSKVLTGGGVEHHTVTRLVQRASSRPGSTIIRSLLLFEGVFLETAN